MVPSSLLSLRPKIPRPSPLLVRLPFSSSSSSSSIPQPPAVGVFWDLDSKPPNSVPPYDAAIRLRLAASSFGPVASVSAFANPRAFLRLPSSPLSSAPLLRRDLEGDSPPPSYLCRVCGRAFRRHPSLLSHFHQVHRREQAKRLNRISSARGAQRARLAAALSMKMKKFDKAARELLVPEEDGRSLASELKRAGVLVKKVDDGPGAAGRALRAHVADAVDGGRVGCLVLVSDDGGLSGVVREARMRRLMTVVIGDERGGGLRRCADAGYSWREVVTGKARREGGKARGRWMDRGLLEGLEWRGYEEEESDWDDDDDEEDGECSDSSGKRGNEPWWKLD